ncbi:uncharacterized protein [Drosophila pseudoobscura]|uniref:Uncharacterized protein n=1 Tax=Drosophila pseudoobscura pseudoobscura TaxID=46245 RepID=A0A6I8V3J5_DROPS|nr:uncharacterized protein LOC6897874 [Drosophila pseudoobscura]
MEEDIPIDRKSRVSELRKSLNFRSSSVIDTRHRRSTELKDIPNVDESKQLAQFNMRNEDEAFQIREKKLQHGDDADAMSRYPSYSNFKVNYSYVCLHRYSKARRDYEAQFQKEIANLINFQSTAVDMFSLVRNMAYTSLWPPLHNEAELKYTHDKVFQLTKKEKKRYKKIMSTDYR